MPNSRVIKITDYALIELTYSNDTIDTGDYGFTIVDNSIQEYKSFYNSDISSSRTGNVLDRSSVQIGVRQWARTEQDIPIRYLPTDARFTVEDLKDIVDVGQTWDVSYDTIRVHIISGYTFTSSSGFVLEVMYPEKNGQKSARAATITYVNGDDYIVMNARPMVLNGVNYDKYIEFKVPSLDDLITKFDSAPNKEDAIAYYLTSDNGGFLTDGLIGLNFYEIEEVNNINGHDFVTTGEVIYASVEPKDLYADLAAVIVQNGDYFEYYPTWKGEYIADYIATLSEVRGRYVVIHELTISEQVGFSELYNSSNVILQREDFDQPSLYRPILKNSDTAFSFSIDYTMRLTNENDGSQIIRTSSITSFEPKRFGRTLSKINVGSELVPLKIYNTITDGPRFSFPVQSSDVKIRRIVSPSFYDSTNVSVSTGKLFIAKSGDLVPENLFEWDIIFGQSEGIVVVTPFDNYFRFRVYRVTPEEVQTLDLSDAQEIDIVFETSAGSRYRYALYQPFNSTVSTSGGQLNDTKSGILTFRVPGFDASNMIKDLPGKFYLTIRNQNNIRARVTLDIASDLRGKEVIVPFQEWSQKGDSDLITIYYNLKSYTIEKKYLELIEIVPDGNTGEETVIYRGNVESMDNYQKVLGKIEELRNTAFISRLDSIKTKENSLNTRESELNSRESQLNSKEASLKALETALLGQQQSLQTQATSLKDQQSELDRRNALIKQREDELKSQMDDAKKKQSSSVKELTDVINSLKDEISNLNSLNTTTGTGTTGTGTTGTGTTGTGTTGTGTTGTGTTGTGTTGTGTTGTGSTGGKTVDVGKQNSNPKLNVDSIISDTNTWQDPTTRANKSYQIGKNILENGGFNNNPNSSGFVLGGSDNVVGMSNIPASQTSIITVYYDVYYVKTPSFSGRYEIRSKSTIGITKDYLADLYNKEFVADSRTKGGKYTEVTRSQPRTFQVTEIPYKSKWFVDKESGTDTNNSGQGGNVAKVRVALLEINGDAFKTKGGFSITTPYKDTQNNLSLVSTYRRKVTTLETFKVEVALDEKYEQGLLDIANNKNTFLAGYAKYIDALTITKYDKILPTTTISTTKNDYKNYVYSNDVYYTNTLFGQLNNPNEEETAFKIDQYISSNRKGAVYFKDTNSFWDGWYAIFKMLYSYKGVGDFDISTTFVNQTFIKDYSSDWDVSLAKFYDNLLISLYEIRQRQESLNTINLLRDNTVFLTNVVVYKSKTNQDDYTYNNIKYVQVIRKTTKDGNPYVGIGEYVSSTFWAISSIATEFLDRQPTYTVQSTQQYTKEIPVNLTLTILGKTYNYDKRDGFQVSDYLSGFPPGTVKRFYSEG